MAMAAPEVRFWSGRTPSEAGVTYAVPIERVRWALEQIREHGRVRHSYLGIKFDALQAQDRERLKAPEEARVRIVEVMKGSPAEAAGLRADDLILEVDGRKLADAGEMVSRMSRARAGDRVSLTIWRDGERRTLPATLGERPPAMNRIQTWNVAPNLPRGPVIVAPGNPNANTLRSFVRVGPDGQVAASAAGTGRAAKITLDARDASLDALLKELSRATGLEFQAGAEAAKRRVTLKVENVSVDDLVESLNRLYNLKSERDGDRIMFRIR
jgi:membrane-associated protease RseP (regulator of RpoE activity)